MSVSVTTLFAIETAAAILDKGLAVARLLGLPVDSWRPGDPTRSAYHFLAEQLAARENVQAEYIRAGFLDTAEGDWLTVLASEVYNVERGLATAASGTLTLQNQSAGFYYEFDAGDLTFKNSTTGMTYHSTSGLTLGPGESGTVTWEADDAGPDYTASADEIDELVTSFSGVVITASAAGVGTAEQSDAALRIACRASLGGLSPNGPSDAYEFVALNSTLTGTTEPTKAASDGDNTDGTVTLYVAGASGPVSGGALTAVEDAVARWATPLCTAATVSNATEVEVAVEITVHVRTSSGLSEADVQARVAAAIEAVFAELPIGGNGGYLHAWMLTSAAHDALDGYAYNAVLAAPAADVELETGEVAVLDGAVTVTVVFGG